MVDRAQRVELLDNVVYGHYNKGRHFITVAVVDDWENNRLYFGVAFCSTTRDLFLKKEGRRLAFTRLSKIMRGGRDMEEMGDFVDKPMGIRRNELAEYVLDCLPESWNIKVPSWAKKTHRFVALNHVQVKSIVLTGDFGYNELKAEKHRDLAEECEDSISYGEEFGADCEICSCEKCDK